MSKKIRLTAILCLLCLSVMLVCSCEGISDGWKIVRLTGEEKTVTVPLEDSGNGIGLAVDLNFTGGGDNTVTVLPPPDGEAPYAVLTYPSDLDEMGFSAVQKDGILTVEASQKYQFTTDAFSMTIYANVTSYDLVGSYALKANEGGRQNTVLKLHITGGAAVQMTDIDADAVSVHVDGAADVVLSGNTGRLDAEINGAGVLQAPDLAANNAAVTVNGVGAAEITVSDALKAEINGAGSISYAGDPTLTKEINGLGSVTKRSEETT
jgi:hypothetical protein